MANQEQTVNDRIETSRLWVKNSSNPRRVLVLTIIDAAGHTTSELVPDTIHPVSLSDLIPRKALLDCRDLFKYIQMGVLQVIDPDVANEYYEKRPEAKQALIRAFEKVGARQSVTSVESRTVQIAKESNASEGIGIKTDTGGVNMRIRALLDTLPVITGNDKKDKEFNANRNGTVENVLSDLSNMELTESDITYLASHSNARIRDYAKAQAAA